MFRRKNEVIDAGEELDRVEGEQGPSDIGNERRPMARGGKALLSVAGVVAVGAAVGATYISLDKQAEAEAKKKPTQTAGMVIPDLKQTQPAKPIEPERVEPVRPVEPVQVASLAPIHPSYTPQYQPTTPAEKTPEELLFEQRGKSKLENFAGGSRAPAPTDGGSLMGERSSAFADKLKPAQLKPSRAGLMGNRDLVMTQGTSIPCVMQTVIVTTQPGMAVCHTTDPTYSASGRVDLIPAGTKIVGLAQGGIVQGQARVFVAWNRLETKEGVIIDLDSPGTGPLGEPGIGGHVDNHFWQRFGGTIMISLIGDLGQAAAGSTGGSGNQINFGGTANGMQQAAAEALRNTINIPPTLSTQQGQIINIVVARDMDFSDVYALASR